jgi:septum formation protein
MLIELASASPRRRDLLEAAGFRVAHVRPPDIAEQGAAHESARVLVRRLCREKLDASLHLDPAIDAGAVRLCADTLVEDPDGRVLGKPTDRSDLERMIRSLSGRTHRVWTAFAACSSDETRFDATESTRVTVSEIPDEHLRAYLLHDEPWDKAGGYATQGIFLNYVARVEGCWPTVVGLPVHRLTTELRHRGLLRDAPWRHGPAEAG